MNHPARAQLLGQIEAAFSRVEDELARWASGDRRVDALKDAAATLFDAIPAELRVPRQRLWDCYKELEGALSQLLTAATLQSAESAAWYGVLLEGAEEARSAFTAALAAEQKKGASVN
jgi:hypothetical protein